MKSIMLLYVLVITALSCQVSYAHTHFLKHNQMAAAKTQATQVIDINQADAKAFASLKGLGMAKANAIVTYRQANGPFATIDALAKVKGIGLKTIAKLQEKNPGRLVVHSAEKE